MNSARAIAALSSLAHEARLEIFRALVEAGPGGRAAGWIAARLKMLPATLTFHLNHLRHAGLVTSRRESRSIIYAAEFGAMTGLVAYLTENCCRRADDLACAAAASCAAADPPVVPTVEEVRHEKIPRPRRRR